MYQIYSKINKSDIITLQIKSNIVLDYSKIN
jgi:hypothetical protein